MRILFAYPQLSDEAEMERYRNITRALAEVFGPHGHKIVGSEHLDLPGRHTPGEFNLVVVDMTDADTHVAKVLARNRFWGADIMMVYRQRSGAPERTMRKYHSVSNLRDFISDHMARASRVQAAGPVLAHSHV